MNVYVAGLLMGFELGSTVVLSLLFHFAVITASLPALIVSGDLMAVIGRVKYGWTGKARLIVKRLAFRVR